MSEQNIEEVVAERFETCQMERCGECFVTEGHIETMVEILASYQMERYGECLVTAEHIAAMVEILASGSDLELKRYKDHVEILELRKRKISLKYPKLYNAKLKEKRNTNRIK